MAMFLGHSAAFAQVAGGPPDAQAVPAVLALEDAIARSLEHNLTILGLTYAVGEQRGQQRIARSRLLPDLTGEFSGLEQRLNLSAMGIEIPLPGFDNTVGPFGVLDWRARLSQTVYSASNLRNHRATGEAVRASELSLDDARDLITLTVGRTYFEALAARARVEATRAQVETATAIHERAVQQQDAGLATPLDVNRAYAQTLTSQHRLATLEADFAKQKIDLLRLTGLRPTDAYDLEQRVQFSPEPRVSLDQAVNDAMQRRSDLQAAEARVRAAELTLSAARGERTPSVDLAADYGASLAIGKPLTNTYRISGMLRVPLWDNGRIGGQVEQSLSALSRRRLERDDLRAQIEADVRKGYVDLRAAEIGVKVAELNVQVARETLGLTRQRFEAGVSDNVAVVQSQQSLAATEFDQINSVLVHQLAILELARSTGQAAESVSRSQP